jgi:hypothetical protein
MNGGSSCNTVAYEKLRMEHFYMENFKKQFGLQSMKS